MKITFVLFFIDQATDPLDAAPPGQPPDDRLVDPLDIVPEDLAVPSRIAFA